MTRTAPGPPTGNALPRVAHRAAVGVGVVLLTLHALAAGTPTPSQRESIAPEQARLRLDPNVATREELMLLPRIGPTLADYIIEYRKAMRPRQAFRCAEDLENVKRIGPLTVANLRPLLRFTPAGIGHTDAEASQP